MRKVKLSTNGLLELGGFGCWGAAKPVFWPGPGRQARAIRLDTTWTRDKPMQMASLRFGDAISGTSSWGGAVRFGGCAVGDQFFHPAWLHHFPAAKYVW